MSEATRVRFEPWLRAKLALISQKTKVAQAIRYALSRWNGLTRFLDDGRIEIDSNVVECTIRPIALNRKNALFAGSDGGGEHWAAIASLIETCKLNGVDPHAYLNDVITKIVNGHPNSRVDELLPWAYPAASALKEVALRTALTFISSARKVIPTPSTYRPGLHPQTLMVFKFGKRDFAAQVRLSGENSNADQARL